MRRYCEVMIAEADRAIDGWPLGRPFQIHPEMQRVTLNVIMRAVFGDDAGPEMGELRERLRELLAVVAGTMWMVPWLRTLGGRFSLLARIQQARRSVDELLTRLLVRRRQNGTRGHDDVLSLLIEAANENGCGLSDQEIRDEMVTLLVAGHETTATALAWTITRVHEYANVVAAAKKELDEVLAGGEPEQSKLEQSRIGRYELSACVIVVPSIDLTHRNPQVWPEPEKFRPERFLESRPGPYEFFPFGGGIRRCIGMSFALFEIKVVLARVLSRCDLRLAPGYRPRMKRRAITIAPSRGALAVMDGCRAV
jgi:cytochrome P450